MFRVIQKFADIHDNYYLYRPGDVYPRKGYKPAEGRIAELSGSANRLGVPLILEEKPEEKPKETKKDK